LAETRPDWFLKFSKFKKTRPEPVKTDENQFKPVQTGPGINVLKCGLNQQLESPQISANIL
jgi:hypothetical protein